VFGTRSAALGGVTGAVVGSLVAVALVMGGALDDRVPAEPRPDASAAFLAAYQRSLVGTYVVRADFTRRLDSGRVLTSTAMVAQRPPDTIRRQFGGITGTVDGQVVGCSTEVDGTYHCSPAAPAPPFEQTVQESVATMTSYFTETPALYRAVAYGDDCFELIQNRPSAVLPYGSQARFCFDQETGAVRLLIEKLEGAVDTFEATAIRGTVSPSDFSLVDDDEFAVHTQDPTTDDPDPGATDPGATDPGGTTGDSVPDAGPDPSSTTSSTAPAASTETTATPAPGGRASPLPHTL
jgi:hypothetical protein